MNLAFTILALVMLQSNVGNAANTVPGHQSADEAAVLAVLDQYMIAITKSDYAAMDALQTPGGMTYQWRPAKTGGMHITAHPTSYWSDPANDDGSKFKERYWSPTVMIRGGIAVVWTPYEFWINGQTSHCGIDVFDFVKTDGRWLVSNSTWTVEPDSCDSLRPNDASMIRPKN
mgnify:CR=1 FL=1